MDVAQSWTRSWAHDRPVDYRATNDLQSSETGDSSSGGSVVKKVFDQLTALTTGLWSSSSASSTNAFGAPWEDDMLFAFRGDSKQIYLIVTEVQHGKFLPDPDDSLFA